MSADGCHGADRDEFVRIEWRDRLRRRRVEECAHSAPVDHKDVDDDPYAAEEHGTFNGWFGTGAL